MVSLLSLSDAPAHNCQCISDWIEIRRLYRPFNPLDVVLFDVLIDESTPVWTGVVNDVNELARVCGRRHASDVVLEDSIRTMSFGWMYSSMSPPLGGRALSSA